MQFTVIRDDIAELNVDAIRSFIIKNDIHVSLIVFDQEAFSASKALLGVVETLLDDVWSVEI
jgi:hypothetical protein